jgi:hypothetical protein
MWFFKFPLVLNNFKHISHLNLFFTFGDWKDDNNGFDDIYIFKDVLLILILFLRIGGIIGLY